VKSGDMPEGYVSILTVAVRTHIIEAFRLSRGLFFTTFYLRVWE